MTQAIQSRGRSASLGGWRLILAGALALLAYDVLVLGSAAVQGAWLVDRAGRPLVRDFGCFWATGRLALEGRGAQAYLWSAQQAVLMRAGASAYANTAFPYLYPPFYLFVTAPLGALPYLASGVAWIAGGYGAYLAAARTALGRLNAGHKAMMLAAAAAPAAMFPIWIGQNGLLSAALLGGGLALLPRRPVTAGVLLGLLACKPQLAVLAPLALLAGGRWRALFSAAATVGVMALAAGSVFGWESYVSFLHALRPDPGRFGVLGAMAAAKLQSVYGLLLFWGAAPGIARALQLALSLAAVALVMALWRSRCAYPLKAAGLISAVLLVSPYSNIYDLPLTVMAVLFLVQAAEAQPLTLWERSALTGAYTLPFFFTVLPCPVGPVVCGLLCAVVAARCARPVGGEASPTAGDGGQLPRGLARVVGGACRGSSGQGCLG